MGGVMELNIRLPGAMALAQPATGPYKCGTAGFILKSDISFFKEQPAAPTTVMLPYDMLRVVVTETALPLLSYTLKWVVSSLSGIIPACVALLLPAVWVL